VGVLCSLEVLTSSPGLSHLNETLPVHYTLHDTFITPAPYTCSRKDERQAGVSRSEKAPRHVGVLQEHIGAGRVSAR
jgi:hypothetical protein